MEGRGGMDGPDDGWLGQSTGKVVKRRGEDRSNQLA